MLTSAYHQITDKTRRFAERLVLSARYKLTPRHKIIALSLRDHYRFGAYMMAAFAHRGYSFEIQTPCAYRPKQKQMLRMGIGMVSVTDIYRDGDRKTLIHDHSHDDLPGGPEWRSKILLDYDYYGPFFEASKRHETLFMPYFMHPSMYESGLYLEAIALRGNQRNIRVFFAGTVAAGAYSHEFLWPYMNRHEIISTVLTHFEGTVECITADTQKNEFLKRPHRIVLALTRQTSDVVEKHPLSQREMLQFASRSDFFINPPGWRIPHSHNVIEAMSVGAIPILNYAALFDPPLEDMKTCFSFTSKKELQDKIELALSLPTSQIAELRANVCRYYDEHLAPDAFFEQFQAISSKETTIRVHNSRYTGQAAYLRNLLSSTMG